MSISVWRSYEPSVASDDGESLIRGGVRPTRYPRMEVYRIEKRHLFFVHRQLVPKPDGRRLGTAARW